jgi:hypothetical protein
MNKLNLGKSLKHLILLGVLVTLCSFSGAFAWRGGGGHWGGGFHGHYWGGHFGWGWYGYPTVVVAGYPYYYDGVYYSDYPIVAETEPARSVSSTVPAASSQRAAPLPPVPKKLSGDTTVINVPISGDKFTSIKLIKYANGYIGPQGEYYAGHPTVAELKALYGD